MSVATRHIALLVGSVMIGLGASEALLRAFQPLPDPYHRDKNPRDFVAHYVPSAFSPNLRLTFETEPGLPGMTDEATTFTVNGHGFRGDPLIVPKPLDEIRIFMVGGSTTECLYLDDADAVTRVLQDRLASAGLQRARVYGAGKSGDMSSDHVAMIAQRIVHLEPDLVIVFAGFNDLRAANFGYDYLHFPTVQDEAGTSFSAFTVFTHLATESQLARLAYAALKPRKYGQVIQDIPQVSHYRRLVGEREDLPISTEPPPTNVPAYARNLRSIIGMARANGFQLVLMTQATTWNSPLDQNVSEWQWLSAGRNVQYPVEWSAAAITEYNDATMTLGADYEVPVFDLASSIAPSLEYFYDDVHFNIRGAAAAGAKLAEFLVENRLVSRTRDYPGRVLERHPGRGSGS